MSWQSVAVETLESTIALIRTMLGSRAQVSSDVIQNGMRYYWHGNQTLEIQTLSHI